MTKFVRLLWSFAVLAAIVKFVLTGHYTAAFLFVFMFPRRAES